MKRLLAVASVVGLFSACPKPAEVRDASVELVDAGVDAGTIDAGVIDAGTPKLGVSGTMTLADGGEAALPAEAIAEVPPLTGFTLHIGAELKDFRVRVIDSADQVQPSDDESRAFDGGVDYLLKLSKPLKPAKTYHLQIDAQAGDLVTDRSGRAYLDYELALKVQGEPEATPGKKPKKKKH